MSVSQRLTGQVQQVLAGCTSKQLLPLFATPAQRGVEPTLQTSTPATVGSAVDALPLLDAFLRGKIRCAFMRGQTLGC